MTSTTMPGRRAGTANRRLRGPVGGQAGAFTVMVVFALYTLVPVWWLVVSATKSSTDLFTTNSLWFSDFNFANNVGDVFATQDGIFGRWLLNSVIYCVVGAAMSTVLSCMAGYALAKYSFRGRNLLANVILGAVLVPPIMFAVPLYLMASEAHLVNTYWAVLLPSLVSPFGVYLSRVYIEASVPDELLEAGRIDGSSEARIFWQVVLPILAPGLVTVFLYQFVAIWSNYLLPVLMLNNDRLQPVTVGLANWREQVNGGIPYTVTITGSFLSVVPLIIAFLILSRYWKTGLAAGSVK
jgi:multiple sugar transport system permease protein